MEEGSNFSTVNILFLGETGVGKSTFINSLVNYLAYQNSEEAVKGKVISVIPSSFVITNDNYERIEIKLGQDDNEADVQGESATQNCKSYLVCLGNRDLRLIDTPGLGDTRGLEQDRLNFVNTLNFIEQFQLIHCICILLKPNNARLTMIFEFCIKQLLMNLPVAASKNIVFLFTNTRGSFYKPGETGPVLKVLLDQIRDVPPFVSIPLNKKTAYCVDSEGFRYLVAREKGIEFNPDEVKHFDHSWAMSANECRRLLKYIFGNDEEPGLTPHSVKDGISMSKARTIVEEYVPSILSKVFDDLIVCNDKIVEFEMGNQKAIKNDTNKVILEKQIQKILCEECKENNIECDIQNMFAIKGKLFNWWRHVSWGKVCTKCDHKIKSHKSEVMFEPRTQLTLQKDDESDDLLADKSKDKEQIEKSMQQYLELMKNIITNCGKINHYIEYNSIFNNKDIFCVDFAMKVSNKVENKPSFKEIFYKLSRMYEDNRKELKNKITDPSYCGVSLEEFENCIKSLCGLRIGDKMIGDLLDDNEVYGETHDVKIQREDFGKWMSLR